MPVEFNRISFVRGSEIAAKPIISDDGRAITGLENPDRTKLFLPNKYNRPDNVKSTVTWLPVIPTSHITTGTRTGHLLTSAPEEFSGVQLIFPNPGASVAIASAAVAVTEDLASPIIPKIGGTQYNALAGSGNQLGWVPVTFNGGSAGATMAPGTLIAPSYLVSDIVPISAIPRTDGGKFSLIMARFYYSATTFPTRSANANGQNELNNVAAPYTYISLLQSTDGVSTPSNFTSTTPNNNLCAIGFIFHTATGGQTVVLCGDSIMSGGSQNDTDLAKANNILSSWGFLAVRQAAAQLNKFIGVSQAALGGATPNEYYARFNAQLAAGVEPSVVIYPPWSPNGDGGVFPPAGRVNEGTWHYRAAQVLKKGVDNKFICLLPTPTPYEAWGDYVREGARAKIKQYSSGRYIDTNEVLYNPAGIGDNKWVPAYRFDAAHPNDAGHAALGAYAKDFVVSALL